MAVIVRNDRGKVLGRFSKVGVYNDLRGVRQRMTDAEAWKFATELAAFIGGGSGLATAGDDDPGTAGESGPSDGWTATVPAPTGPSCEVCGKRFKDGRGLAGHARTHAAAELGVA